MVCVFVVIFIPLLPRNHNKYQIHGKPNNPFLTVRICAETPNHLWMILSCAASDVNLERPLEPHNSSSHSIQIRKNVRVTRAATQTVYIFVVFIVLLFSISGRAEVTKYGGLRESFFFFVGLPQNACKTNLDMGCLCMCIVHPYLFYLETFVYWLNWIEIQSAATFAAL